jgi:hypothetical protein
MVLKKQNNTYEIIRYCDKNNTNFSNSLQLLFGFFIEKFNYNNIFININRDYMNIKEYIDLGFIINTVKTPDFKYIVNNKSEYKTNYKKNILVKEGYDPNKSEHEIMFKRKIYRIYDSGKYELVYNKK